MSAHPAVKLDAPSDAGRARGKFLDSRLSFKGARRRAVHASPASAFCCRRVGWHAGTLAKFYAGLANLQDTAAGERAKMLAAHCRRNDLDVAFDAVFPDFETQTRGGDDQR